MITFRNILFSIAIALTATVFSQLQIRDTTVELFHNLTSFNNINTTATTENYHLFATEMSVSRSIRKVFLAIEQAEGAGARVRRSIGTPQLRNFSPFLMLDHFSIKPGAGFPDQYVPITISPP